MPANRFFTPSSLELNALVKLEGDELKHLRVMRAQENEPVELINGKGALALATLISLSSKEALLEVIKSSTHPLEFKLILRQAIVSLNKLEWILEKGTELGCTDFLLFESGHKKHYLSDQKIRRLHLKLIAALKQSGRIYLPNLSVIRRIDQWEKTANCSFFGDFDPKAPFLLDRLKGHDERAIEFCCGPEEGLSKQEKKMLIKLGYSPISLHTNTLRTETAPLSFLSLAHHHLLIQNNRAIVN